MRRGAQEYIRGPPPPTVTPTFQQLPTQPVVVEALRGGPVHSLEGGAQLPLAHGPASAGGRGGQRCFDPWFSGMGARSKEVLYRGTLAQQWLALWCVPAYRWDAIRNVHRSYTSWVKHGSDAQCMMVQRPHANPQDSTSCDSNLRPRCAQPPTPDSMPGGFQAAGTKTIQDAGPPLLLRQPVPCEVVQGRPRRSIHLHAWGIRPLRAGLDPARLGGGGVQL